MIDTKSLPPCSILPPGAERCGAGASTAGTPCRDRPSAGGVGARTGARFHATSAVRRDSSRGRAAGWWCRAAPLRPPGQHPHRRAGGVRARSCAPASPPATAGWCCQMPRGRPCRQRRTSAPRRHPGIWSAHLFTAAGSGRPGAGVGTYHVLEGRREPQPAREWVDGLTVEQPPPRRVGAPLELQGDPHRPWLVHNRQRRSRGQRVASRRHRCFLSLLR
jgi:hypothetical protein